MRADGLFGGGVACRRTNTGGSWMFGAFTRAQPTAVNAQQFGDFVQSGHGYTTLEPVVDVLRRNAAIGGEVRSG